MFPAEKVRKPENEQALRQLCLDRGLDPDEILQDIDAQEFWANDRYVATVERRSDGYARISLHRKDRKPLRDWRDMQRIKNDVMGDEIEAVELFPAESRLMDTANEYWLWCLPKGQQWPLGFKDRTVSGPEIAAFVGAKQREHP